MVYTIDFGRLSEIADKAKRVHVLLAVLHLPPSDQPSTFQHLPVALPQDTAGLHLRLRDINIEPVRSEKATSDIVRSLSFAEIRVHNSFDIAELKQAGHPGTSLEREDVLGKP